MAVALCSLTMFLAASGFAANEQVSQGLDVQVSGRDSGGREVDRVQVNASYSWSTGRRGKLSVLLPWQTVDTKVGGLSSSVSGLKDATVTYEFGNRESSGGQASHWQLNLNLPTGKDSLGASEFTAAQNLGASADGFLAPQFGRGFAAGLRRYWTRTRGNVDTEWYVGYQEETQYTVAEFAGTVIENSGVDQYLAGVNRSWEKGRLDFRLGLAVIAFDTSQTITNGAGRRVESDPNYILSAEMNQAHTDRIRSRYQLTYQIRDVQDTLSPGVLNNLNSVELGDRLFFSWVLERADNSNARWQLGFSGLNSERSKNLASLNPAAPIGPIPGSSRTELYGRLNYERDLANNGLWNVGTDIGLNSDARDYVIRTAYSRQF